MDFSPNSPARLAEVSPEGRVSAEMDAARLADFLKERIDTYVDWGAEALGEPELKRASVGTFAEAGR